MQADILVAGAGPAGSTAARVCAEQGLKVAVFDRATFPRDKPCGGGVNIRAARLLPFDLSPVTEATITSLRISLQGQRVLVHSTRQPVTYMTRRTRLDAFLLEQAVNRGAQLYEGCPVQAVETGTHGVTLRAGGISYQGKLLIIADGASGRTARLAGFQFQPEMCVGLEGMLDADQVDMDAWRHTVAIDYGRLPGGYGWVFPKADHLNIGVFARRNASSRLHQELAHLAHTYGFSPEQIRNLKGTALPMRQRKAAVVHDRLLLAGDAAGLVDPFLGEGIYAAIWSGKTAAESAAAWLRGDFQALIAYQHQVDRYLGKEDWASTRFTEALNILPRIGYAYFHHFPAAWNMMCELLRGEQTYQGMRRRLGPLTWGIDLVFLMGAFFERAKA